MIYRPQYLTETELRTLYEQYIQAKNIDNNNRNNTNINKCINKSNPPSIQQNDHIEYAIECIRRTVARDRYTHLLKVFFFYAFIQK